LISIFMSFSFWCMAVSPFLMMPHPAAAR